MSNVLIGIIGVILFIGLALAGAMILGDDFRSASNSSKAATYVSRIQQVGAAAQMYQLKTGNKIGMERNGLDSSFLIPRFLKALPSDPTITAPMFWTYGSGTLTYAYLRGDNKAAICLDVQRTLGQIGPDDAALAPTDFSVALTKWPVGCVIHSGETALFATIT